MSIDMEELHAVEMGLLSSLKEKNVMIKMNILLMDALKCAKLKFLISVLGCPLIVRSHAKMESTIRLRIVMTITR